MADDETKAAPLYAQLDTEIDGTHYNTGDEIKADLHVGTREVLKARGDIGNVRPLVTITPPPAGLKVEDMNRDQLIAALRVEMPIDEADDDKLRAALADVRAKREADATAADDGADKPPKRGRAAPES